MDTLYFLFNVPTIAVEYLRKIATFGCSFLLQDWFLSKTIRSKILGPLLRPSGHNYLSTSEWQSFELTSKPSYTLDTLMENLFIWKEREEKFFDLTFEDRGDLYANDFQTVYVNTFWAAT